MELDEIKKHIEKDVIELEKIMHTFNDMRGSYVYKKAVRLHDELAKVLTKER